MANLALGCVQVDRVQPDRLGFLNPVLCSVAPGCWRRRQIDPSCRSQLTQLKTYGTVAARGFAGYRRGLPKIGRLGQKIVGAHTRDQCVRKTLSDR
jgi:hypothetical protein